MFTGLRRQLLEQGFCVVPDVLQQDILHSLRTLTDRLLDAQTEEQARRHRSTGSMISVFDEPGLANLIALPAALSALNSMGYPDPRFTSGFVISKPPHGPRLFWHYDWAGWDDPAALGPTPQQVFLMYYLVDTHRENGCLRVIPGSHRNHDPLLDQLQEAHSGDLLAAANLNLPEYSDRPGEVDVPVRAGDLVIGDSRLLHAAHANNSAQRRTVITLWFHPEMASLPEPTQAFIAAMSRPAPEWWPEDKKALHEPLRARYHGPAPPLPWNRLRPGQSQATPS